MEKRMAILRKDGCFRKTRNLLVIVFLIAPKQTTSTISVFQKIFEKHHYFFIVYVLLYCYRFIFTDHFFESNLKEKIKKKDKKKKLLGKEEADV